MHKNVYTKRHKFYGINNDRKVLSFFFLKTSFFFVIKEWEILSALFLHLVNGARHKFLLIENIALSTISLARFGMETYLSKWV